MSLDSRAWSHLLEGLITLTKRGEIVWDESRSRESWTSISSLRATKELRANNSTHAYVLTGGMHGSTPLELKVTDISGKGGRTVAHFKSSGDIAFPAKIVVTQKLGELFRAAEASILPPEKLADEMLNAWQDHSRTD